MRKVTDDDFDENGLLKDGHTYRVPMRMADSNSTRRTLDAALHRPGFRAATALDDAALADARDAREQAYRDYDERVSTAWIDSADDTFDRTMRVLERLQDAADDTGEGSVEGASCTVKNDTYKNDFGAPGHLRRDAKSGKLICVPDKPKSVGKDARDHAAVMRDVYDQYDQTIVDAWRTVR